RVFATHPDYGHYLVWLAPGERCFLDSRLQLFTDVADDFAALSRTTGLLPGEEQPAAGDLLRAHSIAALVLADPASGRLTRAIRHATREGTKWRAVRIEGASLLLVPRGSPLTSEQFDPEPAAFGPRSELPVASNGPSALAEALPWWEIARSTGRVGSWEAAT